MFYVYILRGLLVLNLKPWREELVRSAFEIAPQIGGDGPIDLNYPFSPLGPVDISIRIHFLTTILMVESRVFDSRIHGRRESNHEPCIRYLNTRDTSATCTWVVSTGFFWEGESFGILEPSTKFHAYPSSKHGVTRQGVSANQIPT